MSIHKLLISQLMIINPTYLTKPTYTFFFNANEGWCVKENLKSTILKMNIFKDHHHSRDTRAIPQRQCPTFTRLLFELIAWKKVTIQGVCLQQLQNTSCAHTSTTPCSLRWKFEVFHCWHLKFSRNIQKYIISGGSRMKFEEGSRKSELFKGDCDYLWGLNHTADA